MEGRPGASSERPIDAEAIYASVRDFGDCMIDWIDRDSGELHDPFETIYGEGYGPGIAAHIFAGLQGRFGDERYGNAAGLMIDRTIEKLERPTDNNPFTDIFLYFWSLKAFDLLKSSGSAEDISRWRNSFKRLDYDFDPPNTNARCLLIGTAILSAMLDLRKPGPGMLGHLIDAVEGMQNQLGFIDDTTRFTRAPVVYYPGDIRRLLLLPENIRGRLGSHDITKRDLKPVAYHLFSCGILAETLRWRKRFPVPGLEEEMERIHGIVSRGLVWLDHFIAADGSLSMTERSRDQFWTGGCFVFLNALRSGGAAAGMAGRHFDWWKRFIKEDGSCSTAPNYFSNGLRVGFENYSTMTMYVTQGFSFLFDAAEAVSEGQQVEGLPEISSEADDSFVDDEAGYAHIRCGKSSAGISLRRHKGGFFGGYCPAMGLYNVVVGGSRLRPFPSPSYRKDGLGVAMPVRKAGALNNGVYDGIRAFRGRRNWGMDFSDNAEVQYRDGSLIFLKEFKGLKVVKAVRPVGNSIEISYDFHVASSFDELLVIHPVLLFDGKSATSLVIRGSEVTMTMSGEKFRLTCTEGYEWEHHQERHMLSTSGITSQLYVTVGRDIRKGSELKCSLLLKKLEKNPGNG